MPLPFTRWLFVAGLAVSSAAALVACGGNSTGSEPSGLPACGSGSLLTVSPVPTGSILEVAPLGNLAPSSHTFPADHIYFYFPFTSTGSLSVPVVAPGTIRVTDVAVSKRTGGGTAEFDDYVVTFHLCSSVDMWFGHVSTLGGDFATQVGASFDHCDAAYQTGGYTFQQCRKSLDLTLHAGDLIGTAGGSGQGALDLGAHDTRVTLAFVDPGRLSGDTQIHSTCPLDYFTTDVQASLTPLLAVNGMHRTAPPVCGTIMQDVANTAQGRWFFDATTSEDHHLALVHTNWDPTVGIFSIGTQLPGTPPTAFLFAPAQSGRLNLDFNRVTADGKIYCYQPMIDPTHTLYIQLETASRLRIQLNNASTCGDPATWSFGSNSVTYNR